ncbi:MAG: HD-GYP domain-containing protein [Gemmatimonadaceae bacterium]|nr:HD-GYP domain-containing protein [Gemmatimonadaceae bacterium]
MKVGSYVALVCGLALGGGYILHGVAPGIPSDQVSTLATLACLALMAELLAFVLPRGARGSIAFIPYIATVLLVPSFWALVTVAAVKAIAEMAGLRERIRLLFNVAQLGVTICIAILVYRSLGGVSLVELQGLGIQKTTLRVGFAAFACFVCAFVANTAIVSRVIALSSGARTLQVWREVHLSTIGLDIMASPIVFVFAWIYAEWGPIIAASFWMPILGIRQLHTTNLELEQTNRELLELMIKSIEARDPYTSGHSRRVHDYALIIARALGFNAKLVEEIGTAALLHDVGKIYDKYAPILMKESRLSPEEWAIVKQHPVDGAELVATMTKLRNVVPAVRHHHENWNGTGYPDGLAGENIPLASRVIMLADTLDAMTTKRPYRDPLSEEIVRDEFVRCRGQQFDPSMVDKLLSADFWSKIFPPNLAETRVTALTLLSARRQRAKA